MSDIKIILWDFDGVIMDSMKVRDYGFEEVLKDYPSSQVDRLMQYHHENGGLSRYVKFNYFFEEIRGEKISQDEINNWASKFSEIMLKNLKNEALLISEIIQFIRNNQNNFVMHIVSGSDQKELREICKDLNIDNYFKSIHGSPTHKNLLVEQLMKEHKYKESECVLIGDSINDYEAAINNKISFFAYNNPSLEEKSNISFNLL